MPSKRAPAPSTHPSLVFRWTMTCDFTKGGWAKRKATIAGVAEALVSTTTWQRLPGLSIDLAAAVPYDGAKALAKALGSATRIAVVASGKNQRSDGNEGWIEVEVAPGTANLTAALRGDVLAELGTTALDDFFATARALRTELADELHIVNAVAWCDWADATPAPDDAALWPLRAIADIFEPERPPWDEDDDFLVASKLMADAKVPAGVKRTAAQGLVNLRWVDDPRDAKAVDVAAGKHAAWVLKIAPQP